MTCHCKCGWPVHSAYAVTLACPQCGHVIECDGLKRPVSKQPVAIRALRTLSRDTDQGAGDTVARLLSYVGGNVYKRIYRKLTGKSCGCGGRQSKLNLKYPWPRLPDA